MLFHFEYRCQGRWEAIGSGEGEDEAASGAALADLNGLAGGDFPVGRYRCIAATSAATRWDLLDLDCGGRIRLVDSEAPLKYATGPSA